MGLCQSHERCWRRHGATGLVYMRRQSDLMQTDLRGKRVLVRTDLNIPLAEDGTPRDATRLVRIIPSLTMLTKAGARVILLSHFGRPKDREPELSLMPIAKILGDMMGVEIAFAPDCIGAPAERAVAQLAEGAILLLENTRFHVGETNNDHDFARALARLGDVYVNDAFSVAHRAHASCEGIAYYLPSYAGATLAAEWDALARVLTKPTRPLIAVIGGAKISTKLALIKNLATRVDSLVIGGAMANTFFAAQGYAIGQSLYEPSMRATAQAIMIHAQAHNCTLILPEDVVVASEFVAGAPHRTASLAQIQDDEMILDCGIESMAIICAAIDKSKTLVWNGPMGAFEIPPFNAATSALAHHIAARTHDANLVSIAGGGDTLAALAQVGLHDALSYVSLAGGAFLEWLEGGELPALAILEQSIKTEETHK